VGEGIIVLYQTFPAIISNEQMAGEPWNGSKCLKLCLLFKYEILDLFLLNNLNLALECIWVVRMERSTTTDHLMSLRIE